MRSSSLLPAGLALGAAVAIACTEVDPPSPAPSSSAAVAPPPPPASAAPSDVGRVAVRRLNRAEYEHTVRDLLGVTSAVTASFPADTGAEGFTNNADALTTSPLLLERYEAAAIDLAAKAVAQPAFVACRVGGGGTAGSRTCLTDVLARLVRRAFRRPAEAADVARLASLHDAALAEGMSDAQALAFAVQAVLMSPRFLFRIERDADPSSSAPHAIDDFELASRLSYFLWSSTPDDALLAYAEAGTLTRADVFERQVRRMLRDPRADSLVEQFASDWLVHDLTGAAPDVALFPSFDEDLRASMTAETKAFLRAFVFEDASFADVMDAPFTFLDRRLAAHYGIEGVSSDTVVRFPLALAQRGQRGGLLTHASVLTMTSVATRTSPVRRGEWVLSELLCAPPPPPPPDVPALAEKASTGATVRERMEEHRKNPACASCHALMDPVGFALEGYDAIGRTRTEDEGHPIDTRGQLASGEVVDGAAALAAAIKADPRFAACTTRKLFAYALGRSPRPYDAVRLSSLSRGFAARGYRMTELILDIVHDDAFRMRRGGEP
jgi:hypothetical protein